MMAARDAFTPEEEKDGAMKKGVKRHRQHPPQHESQPPPTELE